MSDAISGSFPIIVAQGTLDGTSGAMVATGLLGCSAPVRSALGVYTVTLAANGRPAALPDAHYTMKMGNTSPSVIAALTSYVGATGVLTFTCLTNLAQLAGVYVAAEGAVWFELSQSNIG